MYTLELLNKKGGFENDLERSERSGRKHGIVYGCSYPTQFHAS
jgi:hypothetical protein